jgi:hypothetical protein
MGCAHAEERFSSGHAQLIKSSRVVSFHRRPVNPTRTTAAGRRVRIAVEARSERVTQVQATDSTLEGYGSALRLSDESSARYCAQPYQGLLLFGRTKLGELT